MAVVIGMSACATRSFEIKPERTDARNYAAWDCERLNAEGDTLQQRAADVAYAVDARVGNNMIALGLGAMVFWPALLAMRPDGLEAKELAQLKGKFEAVQTAASQRGCAGPSQAMPAGLVSALPVALGERLVYEERSGGAGAPRELGLRVTALRRDQIEFRVDLAGIVLTEVWRQDLAGNVLPAATNPLLTWQRLLRRNLELGQVLAGDLLPADASLLPAKLRGQVVAVGPQTVQGRDFDVAVIELFGDAPGALSGSVRLDGVMAIDRRSGVLLRLELRCPNPDFVLRRRLMRVES